MSGSLFNKFAEKAQSAINASPLAGHIPPQYQPGNFAKPSSNTGTNESASPQTPSSSTNAANTVAPAGGNAGSSGGGLIGALKGHGFSVLQNQLRTMQIQYSSKGDERQAQLVVAAQKSVVLDFESAGRDSQTYSKELYLWGADQKADDLKDVTDRLAYLNFIHGSLSTELASKLDTARGPWKTARATEGTVGTLRSTGQADTKVVAEAEVEKRSAITHGEAARWKAIREYAEKLILLSQASQALIGEGFAEKAPENYNGKQRTAEIRATLQSSIDNWRLNSAIDSSSPFKQRPPADGVDPRSFGETHRQELSRTPSVLDKQAADKAALEQHAGNISGSAPPSSEAVRPGATTVPGAPNSAGVNNSTGVNTARLNNTPAPVPIPSATSHDAAGGSPVTPAGTAPLNLANKASPPSAMPAAADAGSPSSASSIPSSHPTIAETGTPIAAVGSGPGPASGSLVPTLAATGAAAAASAPSWSGPAAGGVGGFNDPRAGSAVHESAEDEKKRLEREDRERLLRFGGNPNSPSASAAPSVNVNKPLPSGSAATAAPPSTAASGSVPPNESADDEKKRLAREERERVLRGSGGTSGQPGAPGGGPRRDGPDEGGDLPAYAPY